MTSREALASLAKDCERSPEAIRDTLQAAVDLMVDTLKAGKVFAWPGLGRCWVEAKRPKDMPLRILWSYEPYVPAQIRAGLEAAAAVATATQTPASAQPAHAPGTTQARTKKAGRRTVSMGW